MDGVLSPWSIGVNVSEWIITGNEVDLRRFLVKTIFPLYQGGVCIAINQNGDARRTLIQTSSHGMRFKSGCGVLSRNFTEFPEYRIQLRKYVGKRTRQSPVNFFLCCQMTGSPLRRLLQMHQRATLFKYLCEQDDKMPKAPGSQLYSPIVCARVVMERDAYAQRVRRTL